MTQTQFIVAVAVEIGVVGKVPASVALPLAARAFREFLEEAHVHFGHDRFAWDETAAKILAREMVIDP